MTAEKLLELADKIISPHWPWEERLAWEAALRREAAAGVSKDTRMSVIDEIAAERRRQIEVEGWTLGHDDGHGLGEMAAAAGVYALHPARVLVTGARRPSEAGRYIEARHFWPWDWEWFRPTTRRLNLVKAAALIVAEIERLDRVRTPRMSTAKEMLELADEYEAGLERCVKSGYEEYGPEFQRRQRMVIDALRQSVLRTLPSAALAVPQAAVAGEPLREALQEIRKYCDENLGPSRSSLLNKIAAIADRALTNPAPTELK